ncbi:33 kDa ribonucleoprotein, chloroplastic-like [Andrographis paniculata]|uniref:33 kDa ribonucleoprotein, chloroplastic-like n=1 Tax=Andrographis paniculata TaxID=175694 RepID=UPI0021E8D0F6|nr:33 kDa ribonucleoprotein, chloroplastic-like [Andrographis paniculata]
MSASSVAVAAAAVRTSSFSLRSISSDHLSHRFFIPVGTTPPRIIKFCVINSPPYSLPWCPVTCCASTAFDSVELSNEEEEEEEEAEIEEAEFEQKEEERPEPQQSGVEDAVVSEIEEGENDVAQSADAGRLYVGNLPFSMTSAQLSEIFAEAGRVISVEIVYDRVTDRSRGFSFVTMGSVDEAREAIRLFDGAQIGGRTAKVNFPEVPRGGEREVMAPKIRSSYQGFVDSPHKIYAGNLSWGLTSQGLREVFSQQPGFLSAKVIYDRDSGRSRGFGFITFSSAEDVESALNAMNGVEVEGRPLRLNLAEQRGIPSPSQSGTSGEPLSSIAT